MSPVQDDAIIYKNKLIMVMGMQRSGTTALIEALAQDPALQMETEREDGPIYRDHFLRPEPQIRGLLWRIKRRIILKPISEVQKRSVEEVLEEYADYGVRVAWIYRDPVNVWSSAKVKWNLSERDFQNWMTLWNQGNRSLIEAKGGRFGDQIAVVRYEDLIGDRNTFSNLCEFLGVEERNNLFWGLDLNKGRKSLPKELQARIEANTEDTLRELHALRIQPTRRGEFSLEENIQDVSRGGWRFEENSADRGTITFPAEHPKSIRVSIFHSENASHSPVKLQVAPITVTAGAEHVLSFWARADRPRSFDFGVCEAHEPWDSFVYVANEMLTEEWRWYRRAFVPQRDDDVGRVFMNLGIAAGEVQISEPRVSVGSAPLRELHLHNGAVARLVHRAEAPDVTRVEILEKPKNSTDVQLVQHRMQLKKGESYVVTFGARADTSRIMGICVGQDHDPWRVAGLYEEVRLAPARDSFRYLFEATEEDVRLYFDLGDDNSAVEIDELALVSASHLAVRLELNHGAEAAVWFPPDRPSVIRAVVNNTPGDNASDIQLILAETAVIQGKRYVISFRARADRERAVELNASQSGAPWQGIGFLQKIDLKSSWRDFHYEFNASMDEPRARVHLDMGSSDVAIEVSSVSFREGVQELTRAEIDRLRGILAAMES